MNGADLEGAFSRLNVWRRGGERAPHKPLLALYALGRCARGEARLIPYGEVDERVRELLVEFGPARRSQYPELPFFHLQSDGVWEILPGDGAAAGGVLAAPERRQFLDRGYRGGFPEEIHRRLAADGKLVQRVARAILSAHFPSSLHEDIAAAVGLDLEAEALSQAAAGAAAAGTAARPGARDPLFREQVMRAYEYRCAVCGFQGRLGHARQVFQGPGRWVPADDGAASRSGG